MNKKRDISYELIRVLSMFFIVFDHNLTSYFDSNISSIIEPILVVGVTLFFMLSGKFAFKINLDDKSLYKKYYWKKVIGLIIPMLVYMAIKNWHVMVYNKHLDITLFSYLRHFGIALVNGFNYMEYWFLYTLIALLIAVPFTARMMQNMKLRDKKAFFVVGLIMATLSTFIPTILKVDFAVEYYFIGHILFFHLGFIIEDIFAEKTTKKKLYIAGILGIIATIIMVKLGKTTGYKSFSPFYLLFTSAAFIGIHELGKKLPKKCEKAILFLGKHSLGVYMIHMMFLYIVRDLDFFPTNIFGYLGCTITAIALSVISSAILDSTVIKWIQKPCKKIVEE